MSTLNHTTATIFHLIMGILIFAALIRLALTGDLVIGFGAVLLIGLDTLMFRKRRENLPKSK